MSELLFQYHKVHPTTWAYLSSLLMLGLFFRFSRFWSVRNVDLGLLILLAPGLLLVNSGRELLQESGRLTTAAMADLPDSAPVPVQSTQTSVGKNSEKTSSDKPPALPAPKNSGSSDLPSVDERLAKATKMYEDGQKSERLGFFGLMGTIGVFLVRLLLDPTMVRRPLLEPNLSTGGMLFMGCSLFVFLMANVVTSEPTVDDMRGAKGAQRMMRLGQSTPPEDPPDLKRHGPAYALLSFLPSIPTVTILQPQATDGSSQNAYAIVAKIMALVAHLGVTLGMIAISYRHFDNFRMGVGAATLYLLLPYTSIMTGRVDHVLPAALLVWAVLSYRRPLLAGVFIGLATGAVYYPIFLLPLWFSFYRQRGVWRFAVGLFATLIVMTLSLGLVSDSLQDFWLKVQAMFGLWLPVQSGLEGIWGIAWNPVYRLPVLAAFVVLSCTLAIWPARKNLGTLLSCSAALMVATQFWHGYGGGLYMGWFLPLVLLTMFRPNLEDRVALSVLDESWFVRRRLRLATVGEAA